MLQQLATCLDAEKGLKVPLSRVLRLRLIVGARSIKGVFLAQCKRSMLGVKVGFAVFLSFHSACVANYFVCGLNLLKFLGSFIDFFFGFALETIWMPSVYHFPIRRFYLCIGCSRLNAENFVGVAYILRATWRVVAALRVVRGGTVVGIG